MQASYNLSCTSGERGTGGEGRQETPEHFPGHATCGSNDTVTATSGSQHVTKVAESGLHTKHGDTDIHSSNCSAVDGFSISITSGTHLVSVGI